jgi:hypothetical protein
MKKDCCLLDLRFLQWWLKIMVFWIVMPCTWVKVCWHSEHITSVFRSEEYDKQETNKPAVSFLLGILFDLQDWGITFLWNVSELMLNYMALDLEDGGSTFLWNVSAILPYYMALQPRRSHSSLFTFFSTVSLLVLWQHYFLLLLLALKLKG